MKLPALLEEHRDELAAFVARRAGWLLRFETADDLAQGVLLRALERGAGFEYEGRKPFLGWVHTVARTYLADRRHHWSALKRDSAGLLRLTAADPAATATGPSTFAARREALSLAVRALALLRPKDRNLVRWTTEDVPLEEQAVRLGLSYTAAREARRRALDRFRKAFRLASG